MPTVNRTTSTPQGYVITTMQAQVSGIVSRARAGLPILASDVAALVSLYNEFVAHYHTASDLRGINTYGNLNVYGSGVYVTSTSTAPLGFLAGTAPANVTPNGVITAADVNAIIAYINSMRDHTHNINDVTS